MGQQANSPLGIPRSEQEILNAIFNEVARALKITSGSEDTTNNWFNVSIKPVTSIASAVVNGAGSAAFLAASAGTVRNIAAIFIQNVAASGQFKIKAGSTSVTPLYILASKASKDLILGGRVFKGVANQAVKISAIEGSAKAVIHYFNTIS